MEEQENAEAGQNTGAEQLTVDLKPLLDKLTQLEAKIAQLSINKSEDKKNENVKTELRY